MERSNPTAAPTWRQLFSRRASDLDSSRQQLSLQRPMRRVCAFLSLIAMGMAASVALADPPTTLVDPWSTPKEPTARPIPERCSIPGNATTFPRPRPRWSTPGPGATQSPPLRFRWSPIRGPSPKAPGRSAFLNARACQRPHFRSWTWLIPGGSRLTDWRARCRSRPEACWQSRCSTACPPERRAASIR